MQSWYYVPGASLVPPPITTKHCAVLDDDLVAWSAIAESPQDEWLRGMHTIKATSDLAWVASQRDVPMGSLLPQISVSRGKRGKETSVKTKGDGPKSGCSCRTQRPTTLDAWALSVHTKPLSCTTEKALNLEWVAGRCQYAQ